jgi:Tfp pilus tip-associated adhesin PilY1
VHAFTTAATANYFPLPQAEYWRHQSTPIAAATAGSAAAAAAVASASSQRGASSPLSAGAAAAAAAAGVPGAGDWIMYGNDVDGSAFSEHTSDPLGSSQWNLKVCRTLTAVAVCYCVLVGSNTCTSVPLLWRNLCSKDVRASVVLSCP